MNLTESQRSAIDIRDSSLIISAGAGSGKTAVLTQRILERICDEKDDCTIKDFLIVTFTNAAAKELSDRMRKKLTERAAEYPGNKKIARNLALLPLAKISTINSFCYELVRTNFHKVGLAASVRICDETEIGVIKQKIISEVVEEAFDTDGDNGAFITAYEIFSSAKNDTGFIETLLNLHRNLTNLPDIDFYCQKVLDSYQSCYDSEEFFLSFFGKILKEKTADFFESTRQGLEKLISACAGDGALTAKYLPSLQQEYDFVRLVMSELDGGYDGVRQLLCEYKPSRLGTVKTCENPVLKETVKNSKKLFCDGIRDFKNEFYCADTELLRKSATDTKKVLSCLFDLVKRFDRKLSARKKKLGIIEFSDCERLTKSLLVESTEPFRVTALARSLRESFKEIYIDEYQDVNPLQDMIFRAISRENADGVEKSRFMVGDVKQSIYRFRGASPDIFMGYRDSFCDVKDAGCTKRIFMSNNFRCSKSVVEFSNFLFRKLMGDYYLKGDELIFSRLEQIPVTAKAHLLLTHYDSEITGVHVSSDELEGAMIADKIKELTNNPKYRDSDGNTYDYGSVAVLARSKSALKTYEKVFALKGIPVASDVGESFYGKKEIQLCMCILKSIDNPLQDIPLAGFMRSFAGAFTDDELCVIKTVYRKMKLYNSVKRYAQASADDEEFSRLNNAYDTLLAEKCRNFIDMVSEYRRFSRGKSASELMWKLFCDMGLLNYCVSPLFTDEQESARRNLLKLYEMALSFNKTSFRGVGAFIDYINSSMEKDDIKAERQIGERCVRLMTVHASKGLEFPVCFVSDLARKFNKTDEKQHLVFSSATGAACVLCDTAEMTSTDTDSCSVRITTPYKKLIGDEIDREGGKEEARILYVALTRARDYLFMTGVCSKSLDKVIADAKTVDFLGRYSQSNSFLNMILPAVINEKACLDLYMQSDVEHDEVLCDNITDVFTAQFIPCEKAYEMLMSQGEKTAADSISEKDNIDEKYYKKLVQSGSFEYGGNTAAPAKLTVSMLKTGLIDDKMSDLEGEDGEKEQKKAEIISLEDRVQKKIPDFLSQAKTADAAEKGTAMHMFMQFADYSRCTAPQSIADEAQRLTERGFITDSQRKMLDLDKLLKFFKGDFYSRIEKSGEIYREQRFNLEVASFGDVAQADSIQAREILVQGVIDLFFKNDDGSYTVVDFKTDRVFGAEGEARLIAKHKAQLYYYCRAVEEMTGCAVNSAYLYSFALEKEVRVEFGI